MMIFYIFKKNFKNSFFRIGKKVVSKKIKLNSENKFKIREKNDKTTFFTNEINQSFRIP